MRRERIKGRVPSFISLDVATAIITPPGESHFSGQLFWKVLAADLLKQGPKVVMVARHTMHLPSVFDMPTSL